MSRYYEQPTVKELVEDLLYFDKINRPDLKERYIQVSMKIQPSDIKKALEIVNNLTPAEKETAQ